MGGLYDCTFLERYFIDYCYYCSVMDHLWITSTVYKFSKIHKYSEIVRTTEVNLPSFKTVVIIYFWNINSVASTPKAVMQRSVSLISVLHGTEQSMLPYNSKGSLLWFYGKREGHWPATFEEVPVVPLQNLRVQYISLSMLQKENAKTKKGSDSDRGQVGQMNQILILDPEYGINVLDK